MHRNIMPISASPVIRIIRSGRKTARFGIKPERKYRLHLRVPGLQKEMSFRFSLMVAGFISRNWSGQKKILDMREVWRSERPIRVCS